ncbi:MAG: hypothetical protein GX958_03055, partial [Desulfitobacterium sp.]|nr:hypothetical protein [Desulfitobacterium sp.]
MIRLIENGVYLLNGQTVSSESPNPELFDRESARKNTIAYQILSRHNTSGDMEQLKIRFDALTS